MPQNDELCFALISYLQILVETGAAASILCLLLWLRADYVVRKRRGYLYRHCRHAPAVTLLMEDIKTRRGAYEADLASLGLNQIYHFPAWIKVQAQTTPAAFLLSHTKLAQLPKQDRLLLLRRIANYRYTRHLLIRQLHRLGNEALSLLPPVVRAFTDAAAIPFTICQISPQELSLSDANLQFVFDDGSHLRVQITRSLLCELIHQTKEDMYGT